MKFQFNSSLSFYFNLSINTLISINRIKSFSTKDVTTIMHVSHQKPPKAYINVCKTCNLARVNSLGL